MSQRLNRQRQLASDRLHRARFDRLLQRAERRHRRVRHPVPLPVDLLPPPSPQPITPPLTPPSPFLLPLNIDDIIEWLDERDDFYGHTLRYAVHFERLAAYQTDADTIEDILDVLLNLVRAAAHAPLFGLYVFTTLEMDDHFTSLPFRPLLAYTGAAILDLIASMSVSGGWGIDATPLVCEFFIARAVVGDHRVAMDRLRHIRAASNTRHRNIRRARNLQQARFVNVMRRAAPPPVGGRTSGVHPTQFPGTRDFQWALRLYYDEKYAETCVVFTILCALRLNASSAFAKNIHRGKVKFWHTHIPPRAIDELYEELQTECGAVRVDQFHLLNTLLQCFHACTLHAMDERGNVLFTDESIDGVPCVHIMVYQGHCVLVSNVGLALFGDARKRCHICLASYSHHGGLMHTCAPKCCRCRQTRCASDGTTTTCEHCNVVFTSHYCFSGHLENGVCDTHFFCPDCKIYSSRFLRDDLPHECDKIYCFKCRDVRSIVHQCFLQRKDYATEFTGVFTYDFETCVRYTDILLPISVSVHVRCGGHVTSDDYADMCTCRDPIVLFEDGADIGEKFAEYLVTHCNGMVGIAHNMSGFDGHIVLIALLNRGYHMVRYVCVGSKIVYMTLALCVDGVEVSRIHFKDSLRFLRGSLRQLCRSFDVDAPKTYFPFRFMNEVEGCWAYEGAVPGKEYFYESDADFDTWYARMLLRPYNFRAELIRYCQLDSTCLTDIIMKFDRSYFLEFGIRPFMNQSIHTMASLSLAVFRKHYLVPGTLLAFNKRFDLLAPTILLHEQLCYYKSLGPNIRIADNGFAYSTTSNEVWFLRVCGFHGCTQCYLHDERNLTFDSTMGEAELLLNALETEQSHVYFVRQCEVVIPPYDGVDCVARLPINPRDALYGGNTQVLQYYAEPEGDGELCYVDYNSLYPFCMKKMFPSGECTVYRDENIDVDSVFGLIKCVILPPNTLLHPIIPIRIGQKLVFPLCFTCARAPNVDGVTHCNHTDEERALHGTWPSPEIQFALTYGYTIVRLFEVQHYARREPLFREFILHALRLKYRNSAPPRGIPLDTFLTQLREESGICIDTMVLDETSKLIGKELNNSNWGKYAQHHSDTRKIILTECERDVRLFQHLLSCGSEEITQITCLGDRKELTIRTHDQYTTTAAEHVNETVASFVTAYARILLSQALQAVGDQAIYCDTDSVVYRARDCTLPTSLMLGELKDECEGMRILRFVALAPKTYCIEMWHEAKERVVSTLHMKGLRKSDTQHVTFDQLHNILVTGESEYFTISQILRTRHHELFTKSGAKILRAGRFDKRSDFGNFQTRPFGHIDLAP